MSDNFEIGKSRYGKNTKSFEGRSWFHLSDNTDNIFRVLPAMFSLAREGKWAQWYAVHRGIRGTNGRQVPFQCIEETDRKTRTITRQCALCNKAHELQDQHDLAKQSGATKDQLDDFHKSNIWPIKAEYKYYINVVNQEGKIGVMAIGSKMFKALDALANQWDQKGFDLTGMQGVFLNFRIEKAFKGVNQAVHKVEVFLQPAQDGSFRFVTHELTEELVGRLKTEAADLTTLFKTIPAEQISLLAEATPAERPLLIDRIFAAGEKTAEPAPTALNANVPGTGATMVGRVEFKDGKISAQMPQMPFVNPPNPATPLSVPQGLPFSGGTQVAQPVPVPVSSVLPLANPAPVAKPAPFAFAPPPGASDVSSNGLKGPGAPMPALAPKGIASLSDEEFYTVIGQRKP